MASSRDLGPLADFFTEAIRQFGGGPVLDFGCGDGSLVQELTTRGWEAAGCDFDASGPRLAAIERDPYRLPYPNETFGAVISLSVLEHAQNTSECYREIHRVLRPNGVALHLFPAKWYLPTEPHIGVPLVSWLWPRVPHALLSLFALLGVRNEFQKGLPWREVVSLNEAYIRDGLCYLSNGEHERLSRDTFGSAEWPMQFAVEHAPGGVARLLRATHTVRAGGAVSRQVRTAFLLQRKDSTVHPQAGEHLNGRVVTGPPEAS